MNNPSNNEQTRASGCLSTGAGCLAAALIFPFSFMISGWLAFAVGPMNCALPNKCSQGHEAVSGVLSIVILIGGGLGVPLATGFLVNRAVKTGYSSATNCSSLRENDENGPD